jgi:SAM-dependent methyltransferase
MPAHVQILSPVTAVEFPDEWYDLNATTHFWFEWRLRALRKVFNAIGIHPQERLKGLDIGCGTGILREQVEAATAWNIDGFDLNLSALKRTQPGRGGTFYYNIFDQRPELLGQYDIAFLFDVIEHIEPTEPFLRAVMQHLKPGGTLIINVPALELLRSGYDDAAGHYRRYDKPTLRAEVERFGFAVCDVRYWAWSMVPLLLLRRMIQSRSTSADKTAVIRRGFKVPGACSHAILRTAMRLETGLIGRPPFGTSLLMAARKP